MVWIWFVYEIHLQEHMLIQVQRRSRLENRYHPDMGRLQCQVTRIYLSFLGIPVRILHKYRETYYGEVKSLDACALAR